MTLENQDTINNDGLKSKARKEQKKKSRRGKFYLSFMTIVLFTCVLQIAYSDLLNISKIIVYNTKISKSQKLKQEAETKNKHLKNELENFNSISRVESIARNNLKMAGDNEVLVIINTPEEEEKPKTNKEKFLEFFEKNVANKFAKEENNQDFILPQGSL